MHELSTKASTLPVLAEEPSGFVHAVIASESVNCTPFALEASGLVHDVVAAEVAN